MFVTLRLFFLPEDRMDEHDRIVAALRDAAPLLPGVTGCWVAPVSPVSVINAGHIVWRATWGSEGEALQASRTGVWAHSVAPLIAGIDVTTIGYRIANATVRRTGPGIWRALIFRTFADADPALVRELGARTLLLPKYIDAIRGWALSPVAFTNGPKGYTHVWEQEYDSLDGLTGPYMTDPVHWGIVDAYFDAEYPEYIVDPQLIQVVGAIDASIIAPVGPQENIA